jgi:hypothetical protein
MNRNGKKVALSLVAIVLGAGFLMRVIPPETIIGETGSNTVTIDGLPVPNSLLPDTDVSVASKKTLSLESLSHDKVAERTDHDVDLWKAVTDVEHGASLPTSFLNPGSQSTPPHSTGSKPPEKGTPNAPASEIGNGSTSGGSVPPLANRPFDSTGGGNGDYTSGPGAGGGSSGGSGGGAGPGNGSNNGPSGDGGNGGSSDKPTDGNPNSPGSPGSPGDETPNGPDVKTPPPLFPEGPTADLPPIDPVGGPNTPPSTPPSDSPHSVPDSGATLGLLLGALAALVSFSRRGRKE